jgi:hypothetical protein
MSRIAVGIGGGRGGAAATAITVALILILMASSPAILTTTEAFAAGLVSLSGLVPAFAEPGLRLAN